MLKKHLSKNPLRGLVLGRDTEETPKQINPTGFKRFLKSSKFLCKTRFGWETEPTGLDLWRLFF